MMKTLYAKFLMMTAVIMITSGLFAFLAVNTYYHQNMKDENAEKHVNIVGQVANYIEKDQPADIAFFLETEAAVGYKIIWYTPQHEEQFFGVPFRSHNLSKDEMDLVLNGSVYNGMLNFPTETFVTGIFADETINTVGVPVKYQGETYGLFLRPNIKLLFSEVHFLMGGMVIVMAIVSFIAMLFFAKKLIDPITALTHVTKRIGESQYVPELNIERKDEIGQLAKSFQQMTERLQENDEIRKQFISDVSHDFQSPLLNIKGYAQLLHNEEQGAETRKQYTSIIQSETERLSTLTKQLLLLTSLDQLKTPLKKVEFQLEEQIREVVRNYQWQVVSKELSLDSELEEIMYYGDPSFLEKVWDNLVSNAVKYTKEGSISITLRQERNEVVFEIKDSGIGIAEEHLPRLFERFYRADASRNKDIEGTGLGLSIVQQVLALHDGSIEVESEEGKGTLIRVRLQQILKG